MATEASIRNKLALILPFVHENGQGDEDPNNLPDVDELWRRVKLMKKVLSYDEIESVLQLIVDEINTPGTEISIENWNTQSFTFEFLWGEGGYGDPLNKGLIAYLIYHIFYDEDFQRLSNANFKKSEFKYALKCILEDNLPNSLLKRILSKKFIKAYMTRHHFDKSEIKSVIVRVIEKYLDDPRRTDEKMIILSQFVREIDTM